MLIKEEIENLDYPRKDDLYVIIDLIYRKEMYYKADYQRFYNFSEISQAQFKELVASSDGLQRALDFLVLNNLVIRNEFYIMHHQAKGYKIASEYMSKTVPVTITDKNINKRIEKQFKRYRENKDQSIKAAKSRYMKHFSIDSKKALAAINENCLKELMTFLESKEISCTKQDVQDLMEGKANVRMLRVNLLVGPHRNGVLNIMHKHLIHTMRVNAIADGALFFKRNSTNGRLDSNLTSLPRYLRKFLKSDEPLVYLDIKNSQPFFLYTILLNEASIEPDELRKFGDLVVSGTLYETMVTEYKEFCRKERSRDQMKNMVYRIFFSKVPSFPANKKFFERLFPTIMAYISRCNEESNNTLALALQRKESRCVLDAVMPALQSRGIIPLTIHDGFICTEAEADTLKEVFEAKIKEIFGIVPLLHINPLIEEDSQEEDDWEVN